MLRTVKRKFEEAAPDWLYAVSVMPYWILHPHRECVFFVPRGGSWLAIRRNETFFVPSPKGSYRLIDRYERFFHVDYGDVVLDVGAYIGKFTFLVAGRASKVVAIEPGPQNLACLRRNVGGLRNVRIVEKAVWNCKTTLKLNLSHWPDCHTVTGEFLQGVPYVGKSVEVQGDTLNNIISDLGIEKVDFVKMDVEGAEIEALEGAEKVLESAEKLVIAAYHERNGEKTSFKVRRFLEERNFTVHVDSQHIVHARRRSL